MKLHNLKGGGQVIKNRWHGLRARTKKESQKGTGSRRDSPSKKDRPYWIGANGTKLRESTESNSGFGHRRPTRENRGRRKPS